MAGRKASVKNEEGVPKIGLNDHSHSISTLVQTSENSNYFIVVKELI